MGVEWAFIAFGVVLLVVAVRPSSRRARTSDTQDGEPLFGDETLAATPVPTPAPAGVQELHDPLEMPWLDSLLGPAELPAAQPLDDVSEIASVLRFWLTEDQH
jgi:hypothetical protein